MARWGLVKIAQSVHFARDVVRNQNLKLAFASRYILFAFFFQALNLLPAHWDFSAPQWVLLPQRFATLVFIAPATEV